MLKLLGIFVAFYLLILLGGFLFQDKLYFRPTQLQANYSFNFDFQFQEVWLGDQAINGIFIPTPQESRGLILYFHGNADDLQRWANYSEPFTRLGYDFFAIDYPGYGKSKGKPTEADFYAAAESAYNWATERYTSEQIVLYGRSMGSPVASYLSTKVPAQQLILETPFYSLTELLSHGPYPFLMPFGPRYQFPVNEYIATTTMPVGIFQGTADRIVPYASAVKLRPILKDSTKFWTIEGGGHRNLADYDLFHEGLRELLGVTQAAH